MPVPVHALIVSIAVTIAVHMAVAEAERVASEEVASELGVVSLLQTQVQVSKVQKPQAFGGGAETTRHEDKDKGTGNADQAESQGNKALSVEDTKQLTRILKSVEQTMTMAYDAYNWATYNADSELYSQMHQFETFLRQLHRALHTVPSKAAPDEKYLVGLWLDSEACGLLQLSDLVKTVHGIATELQVKISKSTKDAAKIWLVPSTSSGLGQDAVQIVLIANLRLQEETASCAPRSFQRISQSMSDSHLSKDMHTAYKFHALQYSICISLVVIFSIVAIASSWRALNVEKPDAGQLVLGSFL